MNWVTRVSAKQPMTQVTDIQFVSGPLARGDKPVIAICGANSQSKSVAAAVAMVRAQGGIPMFIGNHAERVKNGADNAALQIAAQCDGIIIMGNDGDIDPKKYGQAAAAETKIEKDLARAALEESLIKVAIAQRMPLMGICGGMQRINVICGGTRRWSLPASTLPRVLRASRRVQDIRLAPRCLPCFLWRRAIFVYTGIDRLHTCGIAYIGKIFINQPVVQ